MTGRPGGLTEQTAELIAARLAGKPPWTPVDSDAALAAQLDVSAFTVWKAKQILAGRGLIVKENNGWYVKRPPDEAPRGDTPAPAGLPTGPDSLAAAHATGRTER